ncbi:MAG: shikimate dehydrogenase, partial [Phycisphaeraceae bacterium]|nr:shikimate dehydrogenase [Phycisphaeraceae bacterium]
LVERCPLPSIVTCRSAEEGGEFDGDEQTRLAALEHAGLGERRPAYVDLELASWQRSANLRQKAGLVVDHPGQVRPVDTGLILSAHDFEGRPVDLHQRLEAMAAASACRVIKVAWHARSLRDNLEAFEILTRRLKPTIALCMGEYGLMSRVLARKFDACLTFASPTPETATAPGQPTVEELKRLYRWDAMGPATRVYGVIGHPVGHSMSPAIHNAGFEVVDHDGVYLPMPIAPSYEAFKATVGAMLDFAPLHFRGASVTIPHKENLLRFVEEEGGSIEPLAATIGAANTVTVGENGGLHAANTDYAGALTAVCRAMGIEPEALAGRRVAVIGAGGAARAVVAGFAHQGATVVIYNRTVEKAEGLAEAFAQTAEASGGKVVAAPLENLCKSCCEIFVNCTPVGMHPNVDETPLPESNRPDDFGEGTVVFDTVYNPVQTRLLKEAAEAGATTVAGTEMFVGQAAAQFEAWTGEEAPLDVFRDVLSEQL